MWKVTTLYTRWQLSHAHDGIDSERAALGTLAALAMGSTASWKRTAEEREEYYNLEAGEALETARLKAVGRWLHNTNGMRLVAAVKAWRSAIREVEEDCTSEERSAAVVLQLAAMRHRQMRVQAALAEKTVAERTAQTNAVSATRSLEDEKAALRIQTAMRSRKLGNDAKELRRAWRYDMKEERRVAKEADRKAAEEIEALRMALSEVRSQAAGSLAQSDTELAAMRIQLSMRLRHITGRAERERAVLGSAWLGLAW